MLLPTTTGVMHKVSYFSIIPDFANLSSAYTHITLSSTACGYNNRIGEHNESLPKDEREQFKPTAEKLKKFDEMVDAFPNKTLVTPIDAIYLRKIVRQERSNRQRREKRNKGKSLPSAVVVEVKQEESEIHIPQKGTDFSTVVFDKKDFQQGK